MNRIQSRNTSRAGIVLANSIFLVGAIFILGTLTACKPEPVTDVIETHLGPVQGRRVLDGKVLAFKGIPFAESTAGTNRWRPPVSKKSWQKTFQAESFGSPCPQLGLPPQTKIPRLIGSEDCLSINVWTPAGLNTDSKKPVLVFIYGGGFTTGSASAPLYGGEHLAENDVVVVTFNYRIGALGFLALDGLGGNYGYMDQILALKWIRKNIRGFGGDPDKVTLYGESAGAISTGLHLTNNDERNYFRAAVMSSNTYGIPVKTEAEAKKMGRMFADLALCLKDDRVACLRKKSAHEMVIAQQLFSALPILVGQGMDLVLAWAPNIDGRLIKRQPAAIHIKRPVIIGTNRDEGVLFAAPIPLFIPEFAYRAVVRKVFGPMAAEKVLKRYPPQFNNQAQLTRITTEFIFECASRYVANHAGGDVYTYWFTHVPRVNYLGVPGCKKNVCHASELPFVFRFKKDLKGQGEDGLARSMSLYWTDFARNLNPNGNGRPAWPEFAPGDEYLQLNLNIKSVKDPFKEACAFWDTIGYYQRKGVWERLLLDLRPLVDKKLKKRFVP